MKFAESREEQKTSERTFERRVEFPKSRCDVYLSTENVENKVIPRPPWIRILWFFLFIYFEIDK